MDLTAPLKEQTVYSRGIFHGLPTYHNLPDAPYTAIVTGANGITGQHMVKVLAAAPERWKKIYAVSRRPPPAYMADELGDGRHRVQHVSLDFLSSPEDIAKGLNDAGVEKVDYVFFFSYTQPPAKEGSGLWSNAAELASINTQLLSNLLSALVTAGIKPRRFMLQTGAKHYGFHVGPALCPNFESDPRINLEPNFYYPQEDALFTYCKQQGVQWNVVRPSYVIGAVRDSALNHLYGISVYAAVQAHRGLPVKWPADAVAFDREHCQSTAVLNGVFEEWAVLKGKGDEAFNFADGSAFSWGRFWGMLARWYGAESEGPDPDPKAYKATEGVYETPPRGFGPRGQTLSTFTLHSWSADPANQSAWKELMQTHNIAQDPFESPELRAQVFAMSDSAVIGGWPLSLSMRKARKMGWLGTVDSYESAFWAIRRLGELGLVVPMKVERFEG